MSSDVAARMRGAIERYSYSPDADAAPPPDALLQRLAEDVDELKVELRRARSERLEDLTLVVDLLTTSWRAVDRRLADIDRKLDRLDERRPRLP